MTRPKKLSRWAIALGTLAVVVAVVRVLGRSGAKPAKPPTVEPEAISRLQSEGGSTHLATTI